MATENIKITNNCRRRRRSLNNIRHNPRNIGK